MLGDPYAGLGYAIFVYALAGLVLAGLALLLYRRRALECAGDVISVRWVRPSLQIRRGLLHCRNTEPLPVDYCFYPGFAPRSRGLSWFSWWCGARWAISWPRCCCTRASGYSVALEGLLVFLAALVLAVGALEFDLTGYEDRVPDAGEVQTPGPAGTEPPPMTTPGYNPVLTRHPGGARTLIGLHQRHYRASRTELEEADPWESTAHSLQISRRVYRGCGGVQRLRF